jgi:vancomycin aglycone glucosyltransferase
LRIALTSEGTRGDIDPLLALAERFRERDHESLLCASPDFAQAAAEKQLEFQPIERSVRAFMREHADAVARGGVALLRSIRTYWTTALADQFEQLPKAARGSGLIIDAGVQAAAASTAEIYGIPYRYVVCCPSLLPSRCPVPFDQIPCLHAFDTHPLPAKREAFLNSGHRPSTSALAA